LIINLFKDKIMRC